LIKPYNISFEKTKLLFWGGGGGTGLHCDLHKAYPNSPPHLMEMVNDN